MPIADVNHRIACALIAAVFGNSGAPARAADPTTELAAGGLVYAGQQIFITRQEDIVISVERIRVTYTIENVAPAPRTALMAFALPDLDMPALDGSQVENPAYDPLNPTNFVGFTALVGGQPAETYVESRALSLGLVDATRTLLDLALPLYPLHPDIAERLSALPDAAKEDLLARSLIRAIDGQLEPQWTLKTTLFWQQPFAAGQSQIITISYRPIVGSSTWSPETSALLQQRFCVPPTAAAELTRRAAGPAPVTVKWVQFQASAGASVRGAAATYRVSLEAKSPKQPAYTCRNGLNAPTASGTREHIQSDALPEDEIQVLFVD